MENNNEGNVKVERRVRRVPKWIGSFAKTWCIANTGFWIGVAALSVGKTPDVSGPYSEWLPFQMAMVIGMPALLGYLAGKSDA